MRKNIILSSLIILVALVLIGCERNTTQSMKEKTTITSNSSCISSGANTTITQSDNKTTTEIATTKKNEIIVRITLIMAEYTAIADSGDYSAKAEPDSQYNYVYITVTNLNGVFTDEYVFYVNGKKVNVESVSDDGDKVTLKVRDTNWSEIV